MIEHKVVRPQSSPAQPDRDGLIQFSLAESGIFVKWLSLTRSSSSTSQMVIKSKEKQSRGKKKTAGRKVGFERKLH